MNTYTPQPINTDGIIIPPTLLELVEELAVNSHDVWAKQRLQDGWSYGKERNDVKKLHPCLVPYVQLPESEKEYDRIIVAAAVKSIIKLGYEITRKD